MSDTETIRNKLIMQYDQLYAIAKNKVDTLAAIGVTKTVIEVLDSFIEDAKKEHTAPYWTSDYYDRGVILKTGKMIVYSQPGDKNSGITKKTTVGSGQDKIEMEYMIPSIRNFGRNSTIDFGQEWEALEEEAKNAYMPDDFMFYVGGSSCS